LLDVLQDSDQVTPFEPFATVTVKLAVPAALTEVAGDT
jgi:hypothetical protein